MIYEFNGGLGNQMFQYAFYLSLRNQYPNLKYECYIRRGPMEKSHYGYELEKMFGIKVDETGWLNTILSDKFYRKVHIPYHIVQDKLQGFDEEVYKRINNKSFVRGSWQSEKYFSGIKEKIRKAFTFQPMNDLKNTELLKNIRGCESVSIHVRRGDYLNHPTIYVDLSEGNYYHTAINYIKEHINNPTWYVFSDDIDWCKNHLDIKGAIYVDHNIGNLSCYDMYLMSMCEHNIIANSTFSWWGAWLNRNPNKIIISPDIFLKNYKQLNNDIVCENWKVISV